MTRSRQNRLKKAINEQKLSKLLNTKYSKKKRDVFRVLVKYAIDLKKWIANVYYALSIWRRENVFWRLKCFMKYQKVKRMLCWNRKEKFFSVTKQLVLIMNTIEEQVILNNEKGTRTWFYKLWLESIQL